MAERVGDGVAERGAEFPHVGSAGGGGEALFAPEFASHGGEGVSEGRLLLAMPRRWRRWPCLGRELRCEQGDEQEQPEQARRRPGEGLVRPSALRLDAGLAVVGAKQGLRAEAAW